MFCHKPFHTLLYVQLGGMFQKKLKKMERFRENVLPIYMEGRFYRTLNKKRYCV